MSKTFAPSEIAERYGVDHGKVLRWIDNGQLRAVNVATNPGGRPRWRVPEEALAEFEVARTNSSPVKASRRRPAHVERRYY
jgi:excisionase family DNA binding protein